MADWQPSKRWADTFRPLIFAELRHVVGDIVVLEDATTEQDRSDGFDYVIRTDLGNVACRVRQTDFRDVTIRSRRPSGVATELDKLRHGHARLYFYGWLNETETAFDDFVIFDVARFLAGALPERHREIWNPDGSSAFVPVPAGDLFAVPGCVVRSSQTLIPAIDPIGQLSILHSGGAR